MDPDVSRYANRNLSSLESPLVVGSESGKDPSVFELLFWWQHRNRNTFNSSDDLFLPESIRKKTVRNLCKKDTFQLLNDVRKFGLIEKFQILDDTKIFQESA